MCIRDRVDIGDVWSEASGENGQPEMVKNTLYVPEGKKPLILSFDDTNYYPYMLENGFTYKLILDDDGKICLLYTSWGFWTRTPAPPWTITTAPSCTAS